MVYLFFPHIPRLKKNFKALPKIKLQYYIQLSKLKESGFPKDSF